jgi:hypothetical protein
VPSFCSVEGGFGEEDMLHVATQGWRCVVFPGASAKFVCELLEIWCSTRTERAWSNVGVVRTSDLRGRRPHFLHNVLLADRSFSGRGTSCYDMECEVPTGRACWVMVGG